MAPSNGFSGEMSGIGMGMGILLSSSWMNVTGSVFFSVSIEKLSDSTFDWASRMVLRARCGMPTLMSGPK